MDIEVTHQMSHILPAGWTAHEEEDLLYIVPPSGKAMVFSSHIAEAALRACIETDVIQVNGS